MDLNFDIKSSEGLEMRSNGIIEMVFFVLWKRDVIFNINSSEGLEMRWGH